MPTEVDEKNKKTIANTAIIPIAQSMILNHFSMEVKSCFVLSSIFKLRNSHI